MNVKLRAAVLVMLVLSITVILVQPHINLFGEKTTKFEVTVESEIALQKAIAEGKPVFLEFYASW